MTHLPRNILPQIPSDKIDEFKEYLNGHGIPSGYASVPIIKLKPIQRHYNKEKVKRLKKESFLYEMPIIISKEGYILDGHHRWLAQKQLQGRNAYCLVCRANIKELIEYGHLFGPSFTKSVHESTIYWWA